MTWEAIRQELRTSDETQIAASVQKLQEGTSTPIVIQGHAGVGKTAMLHAIARQLRSQGGRAVVVRVPSGLDQVERVILELAQHAGRQHLLEVDEHLRADAGRPERALAVLDQALEDRPFLLLVDDLDALGAVDWEAREVFEDRFAALRGWLGQHAAVRTRRTRAREPSATDVYDLAPPDHPPFSLRNDVDHDAQWLWEAASHDPRRFALALSLALLKEDETVLDAERLELGELLGAIWSALTVDLQQVLLHVALQGRPISGQRLIQTLPDATPTSVEEAVRALLLEREGDLVWTAPWWGPWCTTTLPADTVARAHEQLAAMFSAGLVLDDPSAGLRALDILEAHRHLAAIPDLRRAREFARYGVTVLLQEAKACSFKHDFSRAADIYDVVLDLGRRLEGEGIGRKPRAYARHYLHYNRHKADERYSAEQAEQGYTESLKEWPDNALFWSRLALSRFYRRLPQLAIRTIEDARAELPSFAEHQLRTRTVDRLVKRRMLQEAITVWGDFRAHSPSERTVEERLLHALARGWETKILHAGSEPDVFLHRPAGVKITRVSQEYACQVPDLPGATARGPSPEGALAALIAKLRRDVSELRRTLTHTLPPEKIARKRTLLGRIDLVASKLIEGVSDHAWVLGWVERRDGEIVLVGEEDEIFAMSARFAQCLPDPRPRFAKVQTGEAGEPIGPVEELEEPFTGDPDELWRKFQERVSAHG